MNTQVVDTEFGKIQYPTEISGCPVEAKFWQNGPKARVYFTVKAASKIDCGYIDVKTGETEMSSRPASWAKQLRQEVVKI